MIDSHCHLDFPDYQADFSAVLDRTKETLEFVIDVGTDLKTSERIIDLSSQHSFIYASIGIHPHDSATALPEVIDRLATLAAADKVVAIGECGLDYARLTPGAEEQEKKLQQESFISQIDLARRRQLPLVIHCRDAYEDLLGILEENKDMRGVIHCYLGDVDTARKFLALGYYISFTGIITFKNVAFGVLDAVKQVPLDRILVETDAPFLAPVPYRGKRNEPAFVFEVAKKIAEIKGLNLTEVDQVTSRNARALFGIS